MTTLTRKDLVRPNGFPLVLDEHEPKKNPVVLRYTKWKVSGLPVKFDEETELLHIGEDTLSAEDWVEIRGRIDINFMRVAALKKGPEPNKARPASDFFNANLIRINSLKRGMIRSVPKIRFTWFEKFLGMERRVLEVLDNLDWVITTEEFKEAD